VEKRAFRCCKPDDAFGSSFETDPFRAMNPTNSDEKNFKQGGLQAFIGKSGRETMRSGPYLDGD